MNILLKNMLDVFIGGLSYWAIGWGLAYGEGITTNPTLVSKVMITYEGGNLFSGGSQFFTYQLPYSLYPQMFFQVYTRLAICIVYQGCSIWGDEG